MHLGPAASAGTILAQSNHRGQNNPFRIGDGVRLFVLIDRGKQGKVEKAKRLVPSGARTGGNGDSFYRWAQSMYYYVQAGEVGWPVKRYRSDLRRRGSTVKDSFGGGGDGWNYWCVVLQAASEI